MDSQLRRVFGLALLFALVFGTVSAERAVAQTTPLNPEACPSGDTIMVDTDTFLTVEAADAAARADSAAVRERTMQELFDCAIAKPDSTVQFADGTYENVGRINVGNSTNNDGDDPSTNDVEEVTFSGNSANREAVKFTGEMNFRVEANNILIEHITFENTKNIEMLNWPHVSETVQIGQRYLENRVVDPFDPNNNRPGTCRENVEIRNCVFRNTRKNGVFYHTGNNSKTCTPRGFTVADSLFENIGYNNEWEDDYGPGDVGTGIPKIIDATIEGATTHKSGTTPHQIRSYSSGIRIVGSTRAGITDVTITGNTINGTTHSGIELSGILGVRRLSTRTPGKIEISNNIVNNVPKRGIYVWEQPTLLSTRLSDYAMDIKNNLVVNSGNSPWLVADYARYADGYSSVKSILGDGTTAATDKVVDSVLKPEIWSISEKTVEDDIVSGFFGSEGSPLNIYDNFGGAGDPTDGRASEYASNGNRVSRSSSKIPASGLSSGNYGANRADSCIDDANDGGVNEERFACFSVVRFLDPYAVGAIQLNAVVTQGSVQITQNELRDNTLGLVLCGGGECYFDSPYSAVTTGYRDTTTYTKPDISMNNIYGDSRISEDDREQLPTGFAMGTVYASIGELTNKVDLNDNYLGAEPMLFTDPDSESLSGVSEYTLETARLDIEVPLRFITATVTGDILTLSYSKTLDSGSVPAASDFTVMAGGEERDVTAVSVSGATVTLTLASAVEAGDEVTVSYAPAPGGNPIRDTSMMDVAELTDGTVRNNTSPPPPARPTRPRGPTGPGPVQPTPLALTSAAVTGDTLTLTYSETLDEGSVPAAGDFTVMVEGEEREVTTVSVSGAAVTLTLASAVAAGDEVAVSYTPGSNPIRDASGENAAALTDDDRTTVSNNTSRPTSPGGRGGSSGGGCALASGGVGVGPGILLALMVVPFGFVAGGRAREVR